MYFQNPCISWAYEYAITWGQRRGLDGAELFAELYARRTTFRERLHTYHIDPTGHPHDPNGTNPRGFISKSLKNYNIDLARRRKFEPLTTAPEAISPPTRIIEKAELLKEILHEEFARNPIQGWCFFYQRFLEEHNPEEVARQLNISPQSVSSYATQFARALLDQLQQVGIDTIPSNVNEDAILPPKMENPS